MFPIDRIVNTIGEGGEIFNKNGLGGIPTALLNPNFAF